MIKAVVRSIDGHGPVLFLGLSERNVQRLRAEEPIAFDLADVGLPACQVWLFWAPTEEQGEAVIYDTLGGPPRSRTVDKGD